jgi:hypothetical protein
MLIKSPIDDSLLPLTDAPIILPVNKHEHFPYNLVDQKGKELILHINYPHGKVAFAYDPESKNWHEVVTWFKNNLYPRGKNILRPDGLEMRTGTAWLATKAVERMRESLAESFIDRVISGELPVDVIAEQFIGILTANMGQLSKRRKRAKNFYLMASKVK